MLISGMYKTIIELKMSEEKPRHWKAISRRQQLFDQTYNLNFGRQTGKTKAILDTIFDNKCNYHAVYISHNMRSAEDAQSELKARMIPYYESGIFNFGLNVYEPKIFMFTSIHSIHRLRNLCYIRKEKREGKIMVFIDEPMNKKDVVIEELYNFFEHTNYDPYFFVLGNQ